MSGVTSAADFVVHPAAPIGPPIVGFGAEMNPYLFCRPNADEMTEARTRDYRAKLMQLHPQHVRIFILQHWFDGRTERISEGDPRIVPSLERVCRLAAEAGATINLTDWYGPWTQPEQQMKELAGILKQLIVTKHLNAIQYVTVQNEVNGGRKISMQAYVRLYRALDRSLRAAGIRDKLKIIGGDLVGTDEVAWFHLLGSQLSNVCDGYSFHAYWDYWDTDKILRRTSGPRAAVDALPLAQRRPIYVMEFGVRGHRPSPSDDPGFYEDGSPIMTKPIAAMELGSFMLEGINRGYVSFVTWTMSDALYDHSMQYGLMGSPTDGFPLKPSYHLMSVFTHTCEPGWRAVKVDGKKDGVVVASLVGSDHAISIYVLNRSENPQHVSLAGIPPAVARGIVWNRDGKGQQAEMTKIQRSAAGEIEIDVPSHAIIALTTLKR